MSGTEPTSSAFWFFTHKYLSNSCNIHSPGPIFREIIVHLTGKMKINPQRSGKDIRKWWLNYVTRQSREENKAKGNKVGKFCESISPRNGGTVEAWGCFQERLRLLHGAVTDGVGCRIRGTCMMCGEARKIWGTLENGGSVEEKV